MSDPDLLLWLRVVDGPSPAVNEAVAALPLVDHHLHGILRGRLDRHAFELTLTESDRLAAARETGLDSQAGIALRRWCAPLLGLEPGIPADGYLAARLGLSNEEAAARLLPAAGFAHLIVETGYRGSELTSPEELGVLAGSAFPGSAALPPVPTSTVVRLETIAESVALAISAGGSASGFADSFRFALSNALAEGAVGVKSVAAYRFGLDLDPARPSDPEVADHAGRWLTEVEAGGKIRLEDPVLIRFVLWEGALTGRPLQLHTGYGDSDLDLRRADPLLLAPFIRATEGLCPILLLHTYPFQRDAGYLAEIFPHVFVDVGLAVSHAGPQGAAIIAESLELAPLRKVLFSSDGWGIPELHLLGSWLFRRGIARVLGRWVADGDWTIADAERALALIGVENAARVYGLPPVRSQAREPAREPGPAPGQGSR